MRLSFKKGRPDRIVDEHTGIELRLHSGPTMEDAYFGFHDPKAPPSIYDFDKGYVDLIYPRVFGPLTITDEIGTRKTVTRTIGYRFSTSSFALQISKYLSYAARIPALPTVSARYVAKMSIHPHPSPEALAHLETLAKCQAYVAEFLKFHLHVCEGVPNPTVEYEG